MAKGGVGDGRSSLPDLPIAATAEKAGLTVLAVDKDFDLIADVTGQPVETLALLSPVPHGPLSD